MSASLAALALGFFVIVMLRYFAIAGFLYWLCWKKNRIAWAHLKRQPGFPSSVALRREFLWSVVTSAIFSVVGAVLYRAWELGYTRVYLRIDEYGWPYLFLSFFALMFVHDTYFYWMHRWMHLPYLFRRVHKVHHESRNPSPWAAFSFHPFESILEAAAFPLMIFLIPAHPVVLVTLLTFMTVTSVFNHLGYELYPARVTFLFRDLINATHHDLHHRYTRGNYGLYFTWWDKWMKTEHPQYAGEVRKLSEGRFSSHRLADLSRSHP